MESTAIAYRPLGPRQRQLEVLEEHRPVGQPGHLVVARVVHDPLLGLAPLRDVVLHAHDVRDLARAPRTGEIVSSFQNVLPSLR